MRVMSETAGMPFMPEGTLDEIGAVEGAASIAASSAFMRVIISVKMKSSIM